MAMTGIANLQQTVLKAINDNADNSEMNLADLAIKTGLSHRKVSNGACKLITRSFIIRANKGCYQITLAGKKAVLDGTVLKSGPQKKLTQSKPRRPKKETFRDRLWRAMRIHYAAGKKFTIPDLVGLASKGDEKDPAENTRKFIRTLIYGGFIKEMPRRGKGSALTSNGFKRFMMVKDTGRLAPIHRPSKKETYDPNTDEVFPWIG